LYEWKGGKILFGMYCVTGLMGGKGGRIEDVVFGLCHIFGMNEGIVTFYLVVEG